MRYTKELLVFGLGLIVGLPLIVAEVPSFGLIGSAIMALGLVGCIALVADGRIAFSRWILARVLAPEAPTTTPARQGNHLPRGRAAGAPASTGAGGAAPATLIRRRRSPL